MDGAMAIGTRKSKGKFPEINKYWNSPARPNVSPVLSAQCVTHYHRCSLRFNRLLITERCIV